MRRRVTWGTFLISLFIGVFALFCVLPLLLVLMVSVTSEDVIKTFGFSFFPREFSLYAYQILFVRGSFVVRAYIVSILVTVVGTALAVVTTTMGAYLLANKGVRYRNALAMYFFITMVFSTGVVPWYFMCRTLGLLDNFFSLIVPGLMFSPFNLFLARNFMLSIPDELRECSMLDGANDAVIAFRIYFPLCLPVVATIALFYGLGYWNDWYNAIMLVDNETLFPIQYILVRLQSQLRMITQLQSSFGQGIQSVSTPLESSKMATAIITIGPIILLYPLLQRYFVKGLLIGSVKG